MLDEPVPYIDDASLCSLSLTHEKKKKGGGEGKGKWERERERGEGDSFFITSSNVKISRKESLHLTRDVKSLTLCNYSKEKFINLAI